MKLHFDYSSKFVTRLAAGLALDTKPEDRRLAMEILIKVADIAHTCKLGDLNKKWTAVCDGTF